MLANLPLLPGVHSCIQLLSGLQPAVALASPAWQGPAPVFSAGASMLCRALASHLPACRLTLLLPTTTMALRLCRPPLLVPLLVLLTSTSFMRKFSGEAVGCSSCMERSAPPSISMSLPLPDSICRSRNLQGHRASSEAAAMCTQGLLGKACSLSLPFVSMSRVSVCGSTWR